MASASKQTGHGPNLGHASSPSKRTSVQSEHTPCLHRWMSMRLKERHIAQVSRPRAIRRSLIVSRRLHLWSAYQNKNGRAKCRLPFRACVTQTLRVPLRGQTDLIVRAFQALSIAARTRGTVGRIPVSCDAVESTDKCRCDANRYRHLRTEHNREYIPSLEVLRASTARIELVL